MTQFFHHITLNTGHLSRQYRSGVSDVAMRRASVIITEALSEPDTRASVIDDHRLSAASEGDDLIFTLWSPIEGDLVPIMTTGVALKSRTAPALWDLLLVDLPAGVQPPKRPQAPWIADRIGPLAPLRPDVLAWSGDLSRCLAWAWLERRF